MDEAVQSALRRLQARREEVEIEVLEEGRGGFLGIGAKEARIRVHLRQDRQDVVRPLPNNRIMATRRPWQVESSQEPGDSGPRRGDREGAGRGGLRSRSGVGQRQPAAVSGRPAGTRSGSRRDGEAPSDDLARRRPGRDPSRRGRSDVRRLEEPGRPVSSPPRAVVLRDSAPVPPLVAEPELEKEISGFAKGLLARMGFPLGVETHFSDGAYEVRVEGGESDAILIGRRGETLEALQHVLAKMASRGREELVRVRVDISHYKERRDGQLADQAREMGEKVRASGEAIVTEPLSAAERRIIHRTLSELPDVTTHALGEGLVKRVWIGPAGADVPEVEDLPGESHASNYEQTENRPPRRARSESAPRRAPQERDERPMESSEFPPESGVIPTAETDRRPWIQPPPVAAEEEAPKEAPEWGRRPKPAKGRRSR